MAFSVVQHWVLELPLQQQSVLILSLRGPDGADKAHPCKNVVRAYRASILRDAKLGRTLQLGDPGDEFMSLMRFADDFGWAEDVRNYFNRVDGLQHHAIMHLWHGAEILAYKHPVRIFRNNWLQFYTKGCEDFHVNPETVEQMNARLNDWGQHYWNK